MGNQIVYGSHWLSN